ncbi:MAG: radical SAM protein [Candidatus Omnitrophica bacterium]|nr:radical SAM protein [Candidatus Omnitrophota bacterium]MDD5738168.1 radical SAM protein [Candidatus Omnitrophota bacterium]
MKREIKKALLCYPPVGLFQRGEERCQADIEGSATQAPHAPNDLGYIAACLGGLGVGCVIRDYPAERTQESAVLEEIKQYSPDLVLISTTTPTFPEDVRFLEKVKSALPGVFTVAKGSCFCSLPIEELQKSSYKPLDAAVYGEAEFIIGDLVKALVSDGRIDGISGLIVSIGGKEAARTARPQFREDLDSLPFPARGLMNNGLYRNPLTGRPMATILVSRGCPSQCIFCLTPVISGHKFRKRSAGNVLDEIKDCVKNYGIRDFFFRADTFTMDNGYVKQLCGMILEEGLRITWVANSRADVVDKELLAEMKAAGCALVAFGFESGNEDIQRKIKKNASADDARRAVKLCREAGLKTLGFFMIGFPWDDEKTVEDTAALVKELDCDFIEVHIALPFEGTELNDICRDLGLIKETSVGYNYFSNPYGGGTLHLSRERLVELRKDIIKRQYLRLPYIFRTLTNCSSFYEFMNYIKYGFRLLGKVAR